MRQEGTQEGAPQLKLFCMFLDIMPHLSTGLGSKAACLANAAFSRLVARLWPSLQDPIFHLGVGLLRATLHLNAHEQWLKQTELSISELATSVKSGKSAIMQCFCWSHDHQPQSILINVSVCVCVSSITPNPWNLAAPKFACTLRELQWSAWMKTVCLGKFKHPFWS